MNKHIVVQGEDMLSIAIQYGLSDYNEIYQHDANERLRKYRPNPMCLAPGDVVYIPELQNISITRETNSIHTLTVTIPKADFKVLLLDEFQRPFSNKTYQLSFMDTVLNGTTSAKGLVEEKIPANINQVQLNVLYDEDLDLYCEYSFDLGHLDPENEVTGIQGRLGNLGLSVGERDDDFGHRTQTALNQNRAEYDNSKADTFTVAGYDDAV